MPSDVTVIGAGIVGVSCAVRLLERGHAVTLIDRADPGEGASLGNAGLIATGSVVPVATPGIARQIPRHLLDPLGPLSVRLSYLPRAAPWLLDFLRNSRPERVRHIAAALATLLHDAVEEHLALARLTGAERWIRETPYVVAYRDEEGFRADAFGWDLRRELGVPFETLDDAALHARVPALAPWYRFGVELARHGYVLDPLELVRAHAAHFTAAGGTFVRTEVLDLEVGADGTKRLLTREGPREAATLVIAAGAWSGRLAARLGHRVPLESERGYHVTIADSGVELDCPVGSASGKFVATPMTPGLRVAGTVEIGGLDAPPRYARARALLEHARRFFPGVRTERHTQWMGHRPSLPDSLPVIGPAPAVPGVFLAFGHQHVGLTGGPKTGRLIADLASGREPNVDLAPFRVERFGRPA